MMIKKIHSLGTQWLGSALLGLLLIAPAQAESTQGVALSKRAPVTATTKLQDLSKEQFDRLLQQTDFRKYDKATVRQIQQDLAAIYHDHPDWIRDVNLGAKPLTDDKMGPVTLFWTQRYCVNFKVQPIGDFAERLPAEIARIAAFAKAHPAEKAVLLSNDFAFWNVKQPEPQRSAYYTIRRQGTEAELLGLVQQYTQGKVEKTIAPAPESVDLLTSYTYVLTADDITKLQGKDQLISALLKLQDQPFADVESLKKATNEALAGFPGSFKKIWPVVEANISHVVTYDITDSGLLALNQAGLLPSTVQALEPLKDAKTTDKSVFLQKVVAALKKPQKVAASPEATAATATEEMPENDINTLRLILQEAEQADEISLTEASLSKIKTQLPRELTLLTVPAGAAKLLKEIQDIAYPESHLLHKAAQARLSWGIAACMGDTPNYNKYISGLRLTDVEFLALKTDLLAASASDPKLAQSTSDSLQTLQQLRTGRQECSQKDRERNNAALTQVYNDWIRPAINALYQKKYEYHPASAIQWKGGSCGCVLDKLAGTVYGFYPFWKIDGKEQPVNFSVLSRVAYYGLSFDEMGELKQTNNTTSTTSVVDDNESDANAFIREARRYNTKVDWVIEKNDWQGAWISYSASHKAAVLDKLAANIAKLLSTKLTDPFSKIKPYVSLGGASTPTRGDGVTLYFKDYPTDADSTLVFNEFFQKLKTRLNALGPKYFVNVLVSQEALGRKEGIYTYANLLKLSRIGREATDNEADEKSIRDHLNTQILVLLEEPSTDGKKSLRQNVENALHGADRKDLLRSILPVLVFDNKNWMQLQDDLIYFNDNFGGVGFWPLSSGPEVATMQNCVDSKNVARCIALNYEELGAQGETDSAIKKFICQNRWIFRIALDFTLIVLVVVVILYFRFCSIRSRITQHFPLYLLAFGMPPIVLFTLLLLFDPALASISEGNLPFIISLTLLVGGAFAVYMYMRSQQEVPSRAVLKSLLGQQQHLDEDALKKSKTMKTRAYAPGMSLPSRATLTTLVRGTQNTLRRYIKK